MDIAERYGSLFRRRLRSAECLSDRAMRRGSFHVNTLLSRSSALLWAVTSADQRFFAGRRRECEGERFRRVVGMSRTRFKLRSTPSRWRRHRRNSARCLPCEDT